MKALRFFLGAIYVVLIILLMLLGLKNCNQIGKVNPPTGTPIDTTAVVPDTTIIVERDTVAEREAEEIGGSGDLKVTLMWDFKGDIDLHVTEPFGNEIFYAEPRNPVSGGFLDVDNRQGGEGSCENVYWEHPPRGQYRVSLVYYNQTTEYSSQQCTVVVFQAGCEPKTYRVTMEHEGDVKPITIINIDNP